MGAEIRNGPGGHHQRKGGLEVRDQVHEVDVQGGTSVSEMYL